MSSPETVPKTLCETFFSPELRNSRAEASFAVDFRGKTKFFLSSRLFRFLNVDFAIKICYYIPVSNLEYPFLRKFRR